jgi:hypothetical protein
LDKIIYYDYRGFDPVKMNPKTYFFGKERKELSIVKNLAAACMKTKTNDFDLIPSDTERVPKVTECAVDNVLQLKDNNDIPDHDVVVPDPVDTVGQKSTMTNLDADNVRQVVDRRVSSEKLTGHIDSPPKDVVIDNNLPPNDNKRSRVITINDYFALAPIDSLIYDKRTTLQYIKDNMILQHPIVSLIFKRSFIDPLFLRILQQTFGLTLKFGINAMLYTDGYLDARTDSEVEPDFFYSLKNELDKTIFGLMLSTSIYFIVTCILSIPRKKKLELNEALGCRDTEKIKVA